LPERAPGHIAQVFLDWKPVHSGGCHLVVGRVVHAGARARGQHMVQRAHNLGSGYNVKLVVEEENITGMVRAVRDRDL
jgi:hypothetical protein